MSNVVPLKTAPQIESVKALLGVRYTEAMEVAFPDLDPGIAPVGALLLCQIRTPKRRLASGLIVPDEVRDAEKYNTQTALVRAMGPGAFRSRETLKPWPEGAWCEAGDFVRIPKWGGDRWAVSYGTGDDEAIFVAVKDLDVIGLVTGDPLKIKTLV